MTQRLPDFYIIGAMKCATSSLHEQLARRNKFFMSNPKEPNFFGDDAYYSQGIAKYAELFRGARPEQLVGESSTHYTKLPTFPNVVARIAEHTPDARFVYVMREPLGRLVSQYIHEWTEREVDVDIDTAVVRHERFVAYSSYARQLSPYIERFGKERVLPVFFEHLTAAPAAELERVARFLGDDTDEPFIWHSEAGHQNVSKERMRKSFVREAFLSIPVARRIKDSLPATVKDRIKSFWKMKERPALSEETRSGIEARLDQDLAALGGWLGLDLTCKNFGEVAKKTSATWA